jgi:hypothetical protein
MSHPGGRAIVLAAIAGGLAGLLAAPTTVSGSAATSLSASRWLALDGPSSLRGPARQRSSAVQTRLRLQPNGSPGGVAPTALSACPSSWQVVSTPDGTSPNDLFAVAGSSPTDVWALGGADGSTLAEHWDGNRWLIEPSPTPGGYQSTLVGYGSAFNGGSARSPADVWAVGQNMLTPGPPSASTVYGTLVEHYDGARWMIVPGAPLFPPSATYTSFLTGVAALATSDVWAVGAVVNPQAQRYETLIEHWNGTAWSRVPGPNLSSGNNELLAIAAASPTDIWAAGFYRLTNAADSHRQTLVEHWDGVRWTVEPSPSDPSVDSTLFGISAASPSAVWAVGSVANAANGAERTLTLRRSVSNGSGSWLVVSSPSVVGPQGTGGDNLLFAVTMASPNDIWAVGAVGDTLADPTTGTTPIYSPLALHWDGISWSLTRQPAWGISDAEWDGIASFGAGSFWAAGTYDSRNATGSTTFQTLTANFCTPPAVTGLNPATGTMAGGDTVTVTGHGLALATNVMFGSTPAATFTLVSDTSIVALSPPGALGPVDVTISYFAGASIATANDRFTYEAAGPPTAPQDVAALGGEASATVYWSPQLSDGHAPISAYTVTASPGGATATVNATATSATLTNLTDATSYSFTVAATNSAGTGPPSAPTSGIVPGRGPFVPLNPARVLDTRNGTGLRPGPIGPGQGLSMLIAGIGGAPATGLQAVVLNVTVTDTSAASYLTVYPSGAPRPNASNLNWSPGGPIANVVVVPVDSTGHITLFNAAGSVDVIGDIEGYVAAPSATPAVAGLFNPVVPTRVLDTRNGTGGVTHPVAGGQTISLQVAQPGQEAVVLNVTATNATAYSYLTVWPDGAARPTASNLNFASQQTVPNRVVVKVGANGKIDLFNAAGQVDIVADLNGWFTDANPGGSGARFQGMQPTRILDTRNGTGGFSNSLGPGGSLALSVAGVAGIPSSATAVVANVTVTNTHGVISAGDPWGSSYLTAWPDGTGRPTASDLNWVSGETVPNMVVVKLGTAGKLDLYNALGTTDVIVDVVGWYAP